MFGVALTKGAFAINEPRGKSSRPKEKPKMIIVNGKQRKSTFQCRVPGPLQSSFIEVGRIHVVICLKMPTDEDSNYQGATRAFNFQI